MRAKRVAVLATGAAAAVAGALHLKRKRSQNGEMSSSNGNSMSNGARSKASSWTADAEDNLVDLRES